METETNHSEDRRTAILDTLTRAGQPLALDAIVRVVRGWDQTVAYNLLQLELDRRVTRTRHPSRRAFQWTAVTPLPESAFQPLPKLPMP